MRRVLLSHLIITSLQMRLASQRWWRWSLPSRNLSIERILKKCKGKILKPKLKIQQKCFWVKILTKIDFWGRILIFQSHSRTQNIQNMVVSNMVPIWWSEIQKYIDLFYIFLVPVRTISLDQSVEFDLTCSEHFCRTHCNQFRLPNGPICFGPFSSFLWFCLIFIFFLLFLVKSDWFCSLNPPRSRLVIC